MIFALIQIDVVKIRNLSMCVRGGFRVEEGEELKRN